MKQTLQKSFRETREKGDLPRIPTSFRKPIAGLLEDGCIQDIQEARKNIHTKAVEDTIKARKPDRVLVVVAPDVNEREVVDMSRKERTT